MAEDIQFVVTTSNQDVFNDFFNIAIPGVDCQKLLKKTWPTPEFHDVVVTIAGIAGTVTINLFSSWLYNVLKKRSDKSAKISGQQIPPDALITPIYIETMINSIVINNYAKRETKKEPEDI